MPSVYSVTRVDTADETSQAAFVAVHEEAAAWLWARGIKQWHAGHFTLETLRRELAEGHELYVARREGAIAGGYTLQWDDQENWEEQSPVAGYLHALCVSRAAAGQRLGAVMLDYAGQRVTEYGRLWLRLDCWKGNDRLRAYYEGLGFLYQGIGDHGWAALYQRPSGIQASNQE